MARAQSIAVVSPRFSEAGTVGGAETLLKRLAELAADDGRQVTILTTCATSHFTWENTVPPGARRVGNLDVRFFPVDADRDVAAFLRIQQAISQRGAFTPEDERAWIRNSVNSRALLDHLRNTDYDRILAGPYLFGLSFFSAQVHPRKTILVPCLHDEPFAYLEIMKELFGAVGGFAFNTEPERDLARRLFHLPGEKGAVVGMDIEPFEADPAAFARAHGLDRPYVIYSGRREGGKGTPLLCEYLHAFRERTGEDVRLVFTGSGPIEAPAELEPYILDVGFVSDREKREAMAGAVAFIHPSVNESLGIVLLEAWLAGAPALVHAGGEVLRWQCRRSNGGLWFRHYPDFEQELLLLLRRPELRQRMGAAGRSYVLREYSRTAIQARFLAVLDGG
ncbi:MAG TPA: glycosyltransferase family 4 protein [Kiritimatiellia bacterium]|nr:glycosyltransferase family 4 protein [Kiritimatiellia bacterium]HRZ12829.1 glycosyltransferase family 4 protein [Kiritimatiellia bacterium]HSA18219.1 glycosyltransferase family 4 protein [Kiritimatiellia bacterium]